MREPSGYVPLVSLFLLVNASAAEEGVLFRLDALPARPRGITFQDFNGTVYLPVPEVAQKLGVGWTRSDFSWNTIEPENDRFEWTETDRLVLQAHSQGLEVLPMLGYTAFWATSKQDDGFSAPRSVADWQDFVEHVVARYCRPPFNLRYFQVWNEPTAQAGFWHGQSDDEFFEKVYLPAARIIRSYGCQVVFGGWPCSDSIEYFCQMLDKHEAWRWTDILDIHYFENSAWQALYDRYVKTGKCKGIWQTEIGFHNFVGYLPNCYLRALHWAIGQGWTEPNQFKLFWFAWWGAGADGPKCLSQPGADGRPVLTEHGKRLAVMNEVLGGASLSIFSHFASQPELPPALGEEVSTILGFKVGENRIVIALLIDEATREKHPTVKLELPVADKPLPTKLVTCTGEQKELVGEWQGGRLVLSVSMTDVPLEVARGWGQEWQASIAYIVIQLPGEGDPFPDH